MRNIDIFRETKETNISLSLNLDGTGKTDIHTDVPFLDHMLTSWAYHGRFDLIIKATGDTQMGPHHMIEDIAIALGSGFLQAVGNGSGIARFGHAVIPMDEAKADVCVDVGGRAYFLFDATFVHTLEGDIEPSLICHFFQSFSVNARVTMHMSVYGENEHHKVEALFKACAISLSRAVQIIDERIPSTKGIL
jgi:imidazoleglycerol-phosphate dehydratase